MCLFVIAVGILAETCHYCGYEIDAQLDGEQLEALADTLLNKLKGMNNDYMKIRIKLRQNKNLGKINNNSNNNDNKEYIIIIETN